MKARWASVIVRRYPHAWRERYEDEVLALVEGGAVTLRDLADLARGCVIERARALIEPGDHPMRASLWFGLVAITLSLVVGVGFALTGHAIGVWFRHVFGVLPSGLAFSGELAVIGVFMAYAGRNVYDGLRHGFKPDADPADLIYSAPIGFALLSVFFLGLVLTQSGDATPFMSTPWTSMFVGVMVSEQLTVRIWPGRQMLVAFRQFGEARHLLTWAQMELHRCQALAGDDAGPGLAAAQAEVDRLHRRRDQAVAQLHAMGYRSRFRS